jgi:repressor LexA
LEKNRSKRQEYRMLKAKKLWGKRGIMTDKSTLTSTQEKVFSFLNGFVGEKGYPPSLREIASHFGLKGPKGPQKTLHILERKGYIRRVPGGSRAIEIFKAGKSRPKCMPVETGYGKSAVAATFPIPIAGRVTAGEPILAIENIEGYIHLDRNLVSSKNVFLLRVEGDSMIEAHIQDGDFAMVRPQSTAEDGEIVVALIEDEATIKRIFQKRDLIQLEPANQTMKPIVVRKGEKKIAIVGKVVGIFRKL